MCIVIACLFKFSASSFCRQAAYSQRNISRSVVGLATSENCNGTIKYYKYKVLIKLTIDKLPSQANCNCSFHSVPLGWPLNVTTSASPRLIETWAHGVQNPRTVCRLTKTCYWPFSTCSCPVELNSRLWIRLSNRILQLRRYDNSSFPESLGVIKP